LRSAVFSQSLFFNFLIEILEHKRFPQKVALKLLLLNWWLC